MTASAARALLAAELCLLISRDQLGVRIFRGLLQVIVERRELFAVGERQILDLVVIDVLDHEAAPRNGAVVVDDNLAVGRDPDIELRAVDAQLLRLDERSYGVLGGSVLVVAPVGDHPGFGDSGGIIRKRELRDAQRVLVLAAHQHHPVPARGKSVRDAHRKRLRCGRPVERESPGTAGERFEADPVPGGKPLAVERVGVIGTHLAARKVEQPGNVDRGGLLVAFDGFPQSLHLFGRERGVVDACDGHVAFQAFWPTVALASTPIPNQ